MDVNQVNSVVQQLVETAQRGDMKSRHKLWEMIRPFMEGRAYRYVERFQFDSDDIPGICYLAFHESLSRYDISRNFSFISFCLYIVKYHMVNYVRSRVQCERCEISMSNMVSLLDEDDRNGDFDFDDLYRLRVTPDDLSFRSDFEAEVVFRGSLDVQLSRCRLGRKAIRVVEMLREGYSPRDIQREMRLSRSAYYRIMNRIRSILLKMEDWS